MLDYRNSDDVVDDKHRVAGHTVVACCAPAAARLNDAERKLLLDLARKAIVSATTGGGGVEMPDSDASPGLREKKACFVTLTKSGALRGCIGTMLAQEPLHQAVTANARNAALRDPRFSPVQPDEVDDLSIEISVLTDPAPLPFSSPDELLAKLHPNEDGVWLQIGPRSATFLPQVWAQIPDKVKFLEHLCQKAGCAPSAWKGPDVLVSIYHAECFEAPPGDKKLP